MLWQINIKLRVVIISDILYSVYYTEILDSNLNTFTKMLWSLQWSLPQRHWLNNMVEKP